METKAKICTYTVTFMNGGTVHATKGVISPAATIDALPPDPANGSYTFSGWFTGTGGSGTRFGAETTVTSDMTVYAYWTGGGSSGNSGGGGGSSSSGSPTTPTTPTASSATVVSPIDNKVLDTAINEAVNAAAGAAASTAASIGGDSLKVTLKNVSDFTKANADAIIKKAKELGIPAKVSADVISEDGKSVEVRITVDPALITQTVKLDGYIRESQVRETATLFDKFFENKTTVVHLGQEGAFGQTARVAAKVDLAGFDSKNLYFYAYDKKANVYRRIENPAYRIDSNGYLHFDTDFGGDIIISENPLERK